ncbi:phosphodiester glycosidase family protein [Demequina sp. NBRC 110051]|uniref:phosphodiester glycosidase family protein n=1 Tax=Demequina sp. NBRC 110051 TaxID=1570340 RepID=UPI000A05C98E|nr:phosphodiester glycosidase family protein [Demequina sp. NBRC 110051]
MTSARFTLLVAAAGVSVAMALTGCTADDSRPTVTVTASPGASPTDGETTGEPATASAVDAEVVEHAGNRYRVVTLPLDQWDVRVEWPDETGTMLRDLLEVETDIEVATNAGIFSDDLTPGGLLIADGEELSAVNLREGGGNFHLLPNAVFAVREDATAEVTESHEFNPAAGSTVTQATQSGPALLLDGDVHPEFTEGSANLAVRNGVGVSPDGDTVYLAISLSLTNLWDFAGLFAEQLGVDDALYLDGDISTLWVAGDGEPGPLDGPYAGIITVRER